LNTGHRRIKPFLTNRRQRVLINGSRSSWKPVTSGVPQGTVLGPPLFLLYIDDITKDIKSEIYLFGDCILYRQIVSNTDSAKLQNDINKLYSWSLTWQMSLNTTIYHILSISRQLLIPVPAYKIDPDHHTAVDSLPYLRVTISSD
jgi:Reverse transcriptase (RNA-dependent DNA polymerase)